MAYYQQEEEFAQLQRIVDVLYSQSKTATKMQLEVLADTYDLCDDLREACKLVPSGRYPRNRLCMQLNSILSAHGWSTEYGTVE